MNKNNLHSIALASAVLLLFLTLISISASAAPFAYITNCASNNVYVVDTATDTITAKIDVGNTPSGVTVSPDGTKVYVTNYFSNNISVIDTATNTVTAAIDVGVNPYGIAVNPTGTKVYVTNFNGNSVSVIDTATNTVTATVRVGGLPQGIIVSLDGSKVYVANRDSGTVSIIDTATNVVSATISVGAGPLGVEINPSGTRLYVTNYNSFTVSSIDTSTNKVIVTINVEEGPWGVAVNPEGTKLYVANQANGSVSVIDTATNSVTATVKVEGAPYGVAVNPLGTKVYVANYNSNNLPIIDISTNTIIATLNVGTWPIAFGRFIGPAISQPISPIANFSSNITQGYSPLSVQFKDLSIDSTSRTWDFENDGIIDSTDETPVYVYKNPGTYTVNLTASNPNGTSSKTATINVLPAPLKTPIITWNTPADITAGTALGFEQLNATATDPNNGSPVTGTFTYNPEKGTVLNVGAHTLHAEFTPTDFAIYNNTSADVKINVLPVPLKTPTVIWDNPANITVGTALSSTQLNAVAKDPDSGAIIDGTFTYSPVSGTVLSVGMGQKLHVDFTPSDTTKYNIASKGVIINVLEKPAIPSANFWATPITGKVPLQIQFTDKSTGVPTSWLWDFGDKSSSSDKNPQHTYNKAGKYTVVLTVKNELGENTRKISNYIIAKK